MPSKNFISITIVNDVKVIVPASSKLMTTYVLQEQNDWFEDEIIFVRHFIKPGMNVIDIGANYGLYTLTIAKIIGDSGRIWAFEPTETTSACLKKSISENKFNNVKLIQSGLSDRLGTAKLFTSPNSELNSLSKNATPGNQSETISLLTLDHCHQQYGWKHIDFIKLDAEGEEGNILKRSKSTLSSLAPLIMFELKHGADVNLPLINRFKELGYNSYRLIPGLNALIKFDHNEPFDKYLLNLFCCKDEKAELLEKQGIIVSHWEEKTAANDSLAKEYVGKLPFGKSLCNLKIEQQADSNEYYGILNNYIMSLSESTSSSDRVGFLMGSLRRLRDMLTKGEQRVERLVTFSRIAFDAGERALGVQILSHLANKYFSSVNFEIKELFLPACQRYDGINPDNMLKEWLFSSILEQLIIKHAFSTYFTGETTLHLLEELNGLSFINEDMRRRYQLVKSKP